MARGEVCATRKAQGRFGKLIVHPIRIHHAVHTDPKATNDSTTADNDDGYSFYRRIRSVYADFLLADRPKEIPKLVLEVGSKQSGPVQDMYKGEGRIEVYKETERRRDIGAPKLEVGDMVGTERSLWIYQS